MQTAVEVMEHRRRLETALELAIGDIRAAIDDILDDNRSNARSFIRIARQRLQMIEDSELLE